MNFEVTILGSGSATPTYARNPSAQVLHTEDEQFLIDCGEATQIQLARYKIKSHRINHIFISHLHGDHYLGLMGLLSTMHLQGRTSAIHIYAAAELEEIIQLHLKVSISTLRFEIFFHPLLFKTGQIIFENESIEVTEIELNHRIPCSGFLFKEKERPRKINKEKIEQYQIPLQMIPGIKAGEDFLLPDGKCIPNAELTTEPKKIRSYAYCSDTKYDEKVLEAVKGIDLLYHESTFLHEMLDRANETYHTTAWQAGEIAKKAEVKQLLIGHFSARYSDTAILLKEAKQIFKNTLVAEEGKTFGIQ